MNVGEIHVEDSKAKLIKIGLGVAALIALAGGYYLSRSIPWLGGTKVPQVVTEAPGEVAAGFPKGFLIEKGTDIKNSYTVISPDSGISQPVVEYISVYGMSRNIGMFKQYLLLENWRIEREADLSQPITYFTANREGETVNITLVADKITGKISVNIAYAKF